MSDAAMSDLEQNIRQKAGDDAQRRFEAAWASAFSRQWDAKITPEEGVALEAVRKRLLAAERKRAGDQEILLFANTYRTLVNQFPDIAQFGEQNGEA